MKIKDFKQNLGLVEYKEFKGEFRKNIVISYNNIITSGKIASDDLHDICKLFASEKQQEYYNKLNNINFKCMLTKVINTTKKVGVIREYSENYITESVALKERSVWGILTDALLLVLTNKVKTRKQKKEKQPKTLKK